MSKYTLSKELSNNGFIFYKTTNDGEHAIKDINVVDSEKDVDHVSLYDRESDQLLIIYFKGDVPETHNFGLSLDMDGYVKSMWVKSILKIFSNKYDLIEELYRLDCRGLNIKD